jgi:hypothetical protein
LSPGSRLAPHRLQNAGASSSVVAEDTGAEVGAEAAAELGAAPASASALSDEPDRLDLRRRYVVMATAAPAMAATTAMNAIHPLPKPDSRAPIDSPSSASSASCLSV